MKFKWKTFKVLLAFVIVAGTTFWAVNMVRPRYYDGTNLHFRIGSGTVMMTNPSTQPVPVQVVSASPGTFRVSSTIQGVSGSSITQGSGSRDITQLFEFDLPSGDSEFTITRGENISFVAETVNGLQATVKPVNQETIRPIIIATVVIILGALFYASNVMDHRWLSIFSRKNTFSQDTQPSSGSVNSG